MKHNYFLYLLFILLFWSCGEGKQNNTQEKKSQTATIQNKNETTQKKEEKNSTQAQDTNKTVNNISSISPRKREYSGPTKEDIECEEDVEKHITDIHRRQDSLYYFFLRTVPLVIPYLSDANIDILIDDIKYHEFYIKQYKEIAATIYDEVMAIQKDRNKVSEHLTCFNHIYDSSRVGSRFCHLFEKKHYAMFIANYDYVLLEPIYDEFLSAKNSDDFLAACHAFKFTLLAKWDNDGNVIHSIEKALSRLISYRSLIFKKIEQISAYQQTHDHTQMEDYIELIQLTKTSKEILRKLNDRYQYHSRYIEAKRSGGIILDIAYYNIIQQVWFASLDWNDEFNKEFNTLDNALKISFNDKDDDEISNICNIMQKIPRAFKKISAEEWNQIEENVNNIVTDIFE